MRIILDTNIWISGLLLPNSKAGLLLETWRAGKIDIITSSSILLEIQKVLLYPKISKRTGWDEAKAKDYTTLIGIFTENVHNIEEHWVEVERDPKDSHILSAFIASQADALITGDNDLLELKEKYAILTINEFFEKEQRILISK